MAKKSGGSSSQTYDYFGTIGAAVCVGPVDELVALIVDGKTVWPKANAWKAGAYAVNALVAHKGRIWKATSATSTEPGNAGAAWVTYSVVRGATNPFRATVEGYGDFYFYWGTDGQVLDTVNEKVLSQNGHPPYRRQAVIVLKDFLFGRERVSAPTVEVVVRRKPSQSLIVGPPALLDEDGQANPACVLAELLTDPTAGFGLSLDMLDAETWQETANALYVDRANAYISPLVTAAKSLASLVSELLGYFDGWMVLDPADGQLALGRWPHGSAPAEWTAETTISVDDLLERPAYKVQLWGEVSSEVTVRFAEAVRAWKDGLERAASLLAVAAANGEVRTTDIDLPFITRRSQAARYASEALKRFSRPGISGTLTVRGETCTAVDVGALFLFSDPDMGIAEVCRCTGKTLMEPPAGPVRIDFETEHYVGAAAHVAAFATVEDPTLPEPARIERIAFITLPPEMASGQSDRLALLAARSNGVTTEAGVWIKAADASAWYELARQSIFALGGDVAAVIDDTLDPVVTVDVTLDASTPTADLDRLTAPQTEDAVDDVSLMLVLIRAAHPETFELFAIRSATATGGSSYAIEAVRGAFNTLAGGDGSHVWTTGDRAFVIERSAIVPLYHQRFPVLAAEELTATFRIVPSSLWKAGDVADVYDAGTNPDGLTSEVTHDFVDPYAPSADWGAVKEGGVTVTVWSVATASRARAGDVATVVTGSAHGLATGNLVDVSGLGGTGYEAFAVSVTVIDATSFTYASPGADEATAADTAGTVQRILSTAKTISVDIALADRNGDLTEAQVYARRGGDHVVSASPASWGFAGVSSASKTASLTLTEGDWRVFAFMRDASGKSNRETLGVDVRMRASGANVANPLAEPIGDTYATSLYPISVTLSCSTPGASIEYMLTLAGYSVGGSWTAYSGPVSVPKGKTLWARASNGSLVTSQLLKETYL